MKYSKSSNIKSYEEVFFEFWSNYLIFEEHMKKIMIQELMTESEKNELKKSDIYQKWFFFVGATSRKVGETFEIKNLKIKVGAQPIKYEENPMNFLNKLTLNQIVKFIKEFEYLPINENDEKLFGSPASKKDIEIILDVINIRNKLAHDVKPVISVEFDTVLIPDEELSFLTSDEEKRLYKLITAANKWMLVLISKYALVDS